MGQKQSYRLDEGSANRNVAGDGEIAYNTDTPALGQPTSVIVRPVDNDTIVAVPQTPPSEPLADELIARISPMPTNPIEIVPCSALEEPLVVVSVIPATPAADESVVDVEPAYVKKERQETSEAIIETIPPVVVSNIETTSVQLENQGEQQVLEHIAVVHSSPEEKASNLQEEYAVDCEEFKKLAVEETSSPQPMTPPSSLIEENMDLLERIEPLPQIPLHSPTPDFQS